MRHTAAESASSGRTVASRSSLLAQAWANAHLGARRFSAANDPAYTLAALVAAGDALAILTAAMAAHVWRAGFGAVSLESASTTLLGAAAAGEILRRSGAYARKLKRPPTVQSCHAVGIWTIVIGLLLGLGSATTWSDGGDGCAWMLAWFLVAALGITLVRFLAAAQLRRWEQQGKLTRTVAIVTTGPADPSAAVEKAILQHGPSEACLVGVFSSSSSRLSHVDDLMRLARSFRIDEVIVAASSGGEDELVPMLRRLGTLPANVSVCLAGQPMTLVRQPALLFGCPVLTISRRPLDGWGRLLKRAEDVALASALLLLLLPLMLIIAAAVTFDSPGPVLFRQRRVGFNGTVFDVLKFRTMVEAAEPNGEVRQARRNDPRVTRVGRILRKTSLDELPQLLNVLGGDMSVVGPRPHAVSHDEHFAARIDGYVGRHRVQPGITGLAQVNGFRGETETLQKMQRRVEHDLAYIEAWSLLLDVKIILRTAPCLLGRNVY